MTRVSCSFAPWERSRLVFELHGLGGVESLTDDLESCNVAAPGACGEDHCDGIEAPSVPELLFSDLAAGTYRLGIYDGSLPQRGSATLRVTSAPTPMAEILRVMMLTLPAMVSAGMDAVTAFVTSMELTIA